MLDGVVCEAPLMLFTVMGGGDGPSPVCSSICGSQSGASSAWPRLQHPAVSMQSLPWTGKSERRARVQSAVWEAGPDYPSENGAAFQDLSPLLSCLHGPFRVLWQNQPVLLGGFCCRTQL